MKDKAAQGAVHADLQVCTSQTVAPRTIGVLGASMRLKSFHELMRPHCAAAAIHFAFMPPKDDPDTGVLIDYLRQAGALGALSAETGRVEIIPAEEHATFFSAPTDERAAQAVCIALSGASSESLSSLRRFKQRGGLFIVEDVEMETPDSLPRVAIRKGLADHALPVDQIPSLLLQPRVSGTPRSDAGSNTRVGVRLLEALRRTVLPELLGAHPVDSPVRAWVPGCGTGESAYLLAMAILDQMDATGSRSPLEVFATDAHGPSLEAAQAGMLDADILSGLPFAWTSAYLDPQDGAWRPGERLREAITFAPHNLFADPPLAGFDIIDCRDVLSCLSPSGRQSLLRAFLFGLNEAGLLLLGPEDSLAPVDSFFTQAVKGMPVYKRKPLTPAGQFMSPRAWVDLAGEAKPSRLEMPFGDQLQSLLHLNQDLLFAILEELPALAFLVESDYSISFANKVFRQTFGSHEGHRCYQLFQDRTAPCTNCSICFDAACGEASRREWTAADGRSFAVRDRTLVGRNGRSAVLEIGIDITERKQSETALLHTERFIQKVVDSAPFIIAVYDCTDNRFIYANSQVTELLAYTPEEVRTISLEEFRSLIHADEREEYDRALRKLFLDRDADAVDVEFRFRAGGGDWHWLRTRILAFSRTPNGKPRELLATVRDITESKSAEAALQESEDRLRAVFSEAEMGITVIDRHGRPRQSNRAIQEILDYSGDELGSKSLLDHAHPSEVRRIKRLFADLLRGDLQSFETESRFFRRTGETVWCQLTVWPLNNAREEEPLAIAVVQDITDRRRAEEDRRKFENQIQQTQKLESLGVMAGGIAHDFNNLLMGILGNTSLILDEPTVDGATQAQIKEIGKAAEHAAELCKQLLAYAGKSVFALRPLDLTALVEDMGHLLRVSTRKRAELEVALAANLPAIQGDATQIRQILMNLVINAAEAMDGGDGLIEVSTGLHQCTERYLADTFLHATVPAGNYVYVQVSDTGTGMDNNTLTRIFDPFYTTKFTGRGLGLAAVVGIVNAHHGAIKVDSALGRGTTFRVLFPASTAPAASSRRTDRDAAKPVLSGTVLVVDDEEMVRKVAQKMLERLGLRVLLAEDGVEGIEVFTRHKDAIDAVLLDLTMPRMNGEQVFYELRRIKKGVPIIISSGYDEREALERVDNDRSAGFIQKPYQLGALVEKLRAFIGDNPPLTD